LFVALAAGGCSVDLERFSSSGAGYGPDSRPTSSLTPSEPMQRSNAGLPADDGYASRSGYNTSRGGQVYGSEPQGDAYNNGSRGGYGRQGDSYNGSRDYGRQSGGYGSSSQQDTRMASLPPAQQSAEQGERWGGRSDTARQPDRAPPSNGYASHQGYEAQRASIRPGPSGNAAQGNVVEVQQGDTLSSIARQHRVSIAELMSVNNLQTPVVRPGQQLMLPAGKRAVAQRQPLQSSPAPQAMAETPRTQPIAAQPAPSAHASAGDWQGTHTIASGESLYGIARKHNIKVAELQRVNGITEVTKIRPGTVLKVPGTARAQPMAVQPTRTAIQETPATQAGGTPVVTVRPRIINSEGDPPVEPKRVAALGPAGGGSTTDAVAADAGPKVEPASAAGGMPKVGSTGKFRWPVKGKVIAGFGARPDRSHNDGIDISVPQGTDVMASESGVVAYAGNELKGYGNLVLIRHENNWVSAYAHNEELLVKRGDSVKRGQTIAKAGNTGSVDRPQVHFELRRDSKPIDPIPHMEKQ
jgi:murein DD-endopeptidase MepM/ murein hydrolase activator NlpD